MKSNISSSGGRSTINVSDDNQDRADATSSYDTDPKEIKFMRSTGTQMSAVTQINNFKQRTKSSSSSAVGGSTNIPSLPQNFECKYIGKTKCSGLWGIKNIREPVERLVRIAKRNTSLNDLPNVEALISEKGIYIVQKVNQSVVMRKIKLII